MTVVARLLILLLLPLVVLVRSLLWVDDGGGGGDKDRSLRRCFSLFSDISGAPGDDERSGFTIVGGGSRGDGDGLIVSPSSSSRSVLILFGRSSSCADGFRFGIRVDFKKSALEEDGGLRLLLDFSFLDEDDSRFLLSAKESDFEERFSEISLMTSDL